VFDNKFAKKDLRPCMTLCKKKRLELHSGTFAFEEFPTGVWFSSFYRIRKLFLTAQCQSLASFLGSEGGPPCNSCLMFAVKVGEQLIAGELAWTVAQSHRFAASQHSGPESSGLAR